MRRDRGRHADRDALRAVGEQVREGARQHDRLALRAVVGRTEIDRVLVDAVDEEARHLGQPRLGVAHRRRVIAVDVAEVALPVDERIALREILREPHQRVVDRDVAVRMEFADGVADDARALLEAGAGIEAELAHRVHQPAVHGLQPVARVRQRPVHDGGERVGEVALFERLAQRDFLRAGRFRNQLLAHDRIRYSAAPARTTRGMFRWMPNPARRCGFIAKAAANSEVGGSGK